MKIALKDNPVHTRQHGFRSDRSTETAISDACSYIEEHILNRKHVVGVPLEIQVAFDSIYPYKVKEALLRHGARWRHGMVNWYYNYLIYTEIFSSTWLDVNGL